MTEPQGHLSRRSFLAGGGAVLGAALLLGPNGVPRPGALTRLAYSGGRRLSVGYVEGSDGVAAAEAGALLTTAGTRVVPAASLRAAHRAFTDGSATIGVGSLTPHAGRDDLTAYLDALVAPPRGAGDQPLPFYAWTARPGAAGRPVTFGTAVAAQPTLGFSLAVRGAAGTTGESIAVFTGGRERDLPKLRPGLYLFGLDEGTWATSRRLPGDDPAAWAGLASLAVTVHAA